MAQPYIGEIRLFAGNFAPAGWMFCDGQLLPISENDALFTLIGTTYGGDGQETFALPNLQSRVPIHQGQGPGLTNRVLAQSIAALTSNGISSPPQDHVYEVWGALQTFLNIDNEGNGSLSSHKRLNPPSAPSARAS